MARVKVDGRRVAGGKGQGQGAGGGSWVKGAEGDRRKEDKFGVKKEAKENVSVMRGRLCKESRN